MKLLGAILLVSLVCAEQPPYAASGWKPSGERLRLPQRNAKQQVPHTVYGPPSTEAPVTESAGYNYPPPEEAAPEEGAQPDSEYGAPPQPSYGPPEQPDSGYGAPEQQTEQAGYDYPPPDSEYGAPQQPDDGYGAPEQPDSGYGAPAQPDSGYGAPAQPGNEYGAPAEGSGAAPLDPGATERLRQNQFFQQLPLFEPSKFRQPQRLSRPQKFQSRPQSFQSQKAPQRFQSQPQRGQQQQKFQAQRFQQAPKFQQQRAQPQNFINQQAANIRQVPNQPSTNTKQNLARNKYRTDYRTISDSDYKKFPARLRQGGGNLDAETFDAKKIPKPLTNGFEKQGLYTTVRPDVAADKGRGRGEPAESDANGGANPVSPGVNVAVSTAVSNGHYYVLQQDGLLQKVSYKKTGNGQLINGAIISGLKYDDILPIDAPIYSINLDNQLIQLN